MKPPTPSTRYAIYTRESTEKQLEGKEFDSHASQESYLRSWVEAKGGVVVASYSDTRSGTDWRSRPGFQQLTCDAKTGLFDMAVAYDMDRWHRDIVTFAMLKEIERETGVSFLSATQNFGRAPEGELMEVFFSGFAQFQSQQTSRKVKIKRAEMAKQGLFLGGNVPYGYRSIDKKLTPDPDEAEIVRLMFAMFQEHPSIASIQHRLRAMGAKNRKGKGWSNTTIKTILGNRMYIGEVSNAGKHYPGVHDGIVDPLLFAEVQRKLPTKRRYTSRMKRPYPLLSVLVCGECGSAMTSYFAKGRGKANFPYYRCGRTFKKGWAACSIKTVNASRIEGWVKDALDDLVSQPELIEAAAEASNRDKSSDLDPLRAKEKAFMEREQVLATEIDNLVAVLKSGGLSALESVQAALAKAEDDWRYVQSKLARVREQVGQVSRSTVDADRIKAALGDWRLLYEVANPAEKQELIRLIFKRIEFHGPDKPIKMELFDRSGVELTQKKSGSKIRTAWLRVGSAGARGERRAAMWRGGRKCWRWIGFSARSERAERVRVAGLLRASWRLDLVPTWCLLVLAKHEANVGHRNLACRADKHAECLVDLRRACVQYLSQVVARRRRPGAAEPRMGGSHVVLLHAVLDASPAWCRNLER